MLRHAVLLLPLLVSAAPQPEEAPATRPIAAGIQWSEDYAATLARGAAESKVVMLALNMDGERANNQMAQQSYKDREVIALTSHALCLVGSVSNHNSSGSCSRFGTVTCAAHQAIEKASRSGELSRDPGGLIIAPQHVFLGPDGKVILSVPYLISTAELSWCLVVAINSVNPEADLKLPSGARPPKRLIQEGVLGPAEEGMAKGSKRSVGPATLEEAMELIDKLRKGGRGTGKIQSLNRIMTCDEDEPRDFTMQQLRGGIGKKPERLRGLIHSIGVTAPASYWEVVAEYATNSDILMREEAAAALEQLAAPKSVKVITKALKKEKDGRVRGAWMRALGSAGADDSKVRSTLVKAASKEKDREAKTGAIVALGYLVPHKDVEAAIRKAYTSEDSDHMLAAACAMALTRDKKWRDMLYPMLKQEPQGQLHDALVGCLEVLTLGRLESLAKPLAEVCDDRVERERFFGRKQ
ncbi:MAG: hypothetical protein ACI8QC_001687 [Planctomycetota bacterium]|jgi:hypothetical protein